MELILQALGLSLFDSISTTQQIVVFVLLLGCARPIRNAWSFLAALSGTYFACGMLGWYAFGPLQALAHRLSPLEGASDGQYRATELLFGVVLIAGGLWHRHRNRDPRVYRPNPLELRLHGMGPLAAAGTGIFLSVTTFPVSLPYLYFLGRLHAAGAGAWQAAWSVGLYGLGYASPMLALFFLYRSRHKRNRLPPEEFRLRARQFDVTLTVWTLVALGLLTLVDSGCHFVLGHALFQGRWL